MELERSLYLVPTPIGNLADITYRSIDVLKSVNLILAEDTRHSKRLLDHYEIQTPMRSFHMHNEHKVLDEMIGQLNRGVKMALISDAGTPGISDPGFLLARACIEHKIEFEVLPGATSFIPALIQSGLAAHSFAFEGFLPQKKGRKTALVKLAKEERTIILFESPYKLKRTLSDVQEHFGERKISVSRELSKKFEQTVRGTNSEVLSHFENNPPKGEFVIVIEGATG
ncbi:MAG: 16S rRNA (cytidine(1402)-2'-O)-methyltransferase [Bacteroidia bacterium]